MSPGGDRRILPETTTAPGIRKGIGSALVLLPLLVCCGLLPPAPALTRRTRWAAGILMASLASLALLPPEPAQAQTVSDLVSNTAETGGIHNEGTGAYQEAQDFTTGNNTLGYTLRSIVVGMTTASNANASRSTVVKLRANDSSGSYDVPGTELATLTGTADEGLRTFTAPANTMLAASTKYWVTINDGMANVSTAGALLRNLRGDADQTGTGWSIGDLGVYRQTGSTTWSQNGTAGTQAVTNRIAVRGYANTTSLTAGSITHNSAMLTLAGNSATWYYKRTVPTATTCSSAQTGATTTVSLTSLSANTSYTYKAYSDSTCATAIASETFKTDPAATPPSFTTQLFVLFYTNQDAIRIPPATKSQTFTFASGTELIGSIPNSTTRIGMCATGTTREVGWYKSDALTTKLGTSSTNFLGSLGLNYTPTAVGEYRALAYCKRGTVYSAAANLMGTGGKVTLTPAPALSASPVGKTSATLTLANNDAAWYYKRTAPTATTCSSEQTAATTMVSLTSLSANTEYTYKAYSDSTCATAIASVTFTTKPADPPTFGGSAVLTSVSYGETRNRAAGSGAWKESFNYKSGTALTALITPGTITCDTGTTAEVGWYKSTALTTRVGSYSQVGSTTVYKLSTTPTAAGEYRALGYCTQGTGASKVYSNPKNLMRDGAVTLSGKSISLAKSNVKQASATLTITNNLGKWYYKSTASSATCSGEQAAATTAVNLTGLSANTSYTYKAYRDSTCATEIASVTFNTLAAPPLTGTTKIWSATLTVDAVGSAYGCDNDDPTVDNCSSSSVLSDDDFTYGSKTYTIETILVDSSGTLTVGFDGSPDLAPGIKDSGTLNAGNYLSFASAAIRPVFKDLSWRNVGTGLGWTDGQSVSLEINAPLPGVTFSPTGVSVNEGSSTEYTAKLKTKPLANVTVTVTKKTGGDGDLTFSGSPLTFTNSDWDTAQTLTVSAAEDTDSSAGSATLEHSASSGDDVYDGLTISDVVATEVDNDAAGVAVSGSPLAVNEGSSNTYTLVLNSQPSSNVTVTATRKTGGDTDLSLSGSPLTFTNSDWDTAQTLTVSAAEDDGDSGAGSATFQHSASSGDSNYNGASITIAELVANEVENDTPGVTVTGSPLAVNEGSSNTYTLVLTAQPSSNVTVTATRKAGGDTDLTVSGSPLTFSNGNWDTAQTLTVSGAEDGDTTNGSATFQHSASSGDSRYDGASVTIGELVANEVDKNTAGVTVTGSPLAVNEGSSNTYTLVLGAQPTSNVTVTVAGKAGGDDDLLLSGSPLTFTDANWNTAQTLTVSAAEDADTTNGSATYEHSASSGDNRYDGASITISELVANEVDNDVSGVAVTGSPLSINEGSSNTYTLVLNTQPSSNVTVTAARKTGGDTDLSLSGSPLTFTNANWNTAQTLTVSAAEDADTSAGTATFQHSASSGDTNYDGASITISELVANEVDNDAPSANLASSAVTQTSATLTLTGNSAAWSYKQTDPTEGSCSPQTGGTTMVSLTSLSPNTTYTYKAYSDSTCTTEMASARFTTTATSAPAGDGGGGGSSTPPSPPVSVADVEGSGDPGSQTVRITFRQPVRKGQGNITLTPEAENGTASQTRLLAPSTASTTSCPTSPSTITIPVTSDQVTISGATVTIQPATTALPPGNVCMEIDANALLTPSGEGNPTIVRRFRIEDHTAPSLDSTSPGNGATDVAVDAHLVLTFSEPVKKPRKTGLGNIVLQAHGGGSVTIPVASNQVTISGSTVTVNPTNHLDGGATYHVLIPPGAIQDLAGNHHVGITDAHAWRFTTEDNTPLVLTRTNPSNGATDVAVDAHLVLTFNQPVRTGRGSVTITPATGAAVTIPVTDNNQVTVRGRTVTINPTNDLDGGVSYHVLIPPGAIQDLTGNDHVGITDAHAWRFTTTAGFQSAVKAWNARFGRTVADQVLDAVQTRLRSTHVPGLEVHLAGQQLEWPDASDVTQPVAQQVVDQLAQWLVVGSGDSGAAALRTVNGHDLLASSSFAFTSPVPDGGLLSFWGRGAVTSFDGREGEVTLDGQVTTWMLGTDWSWGQWPDGGEARRSTAGLLLSRSTGDGGYTGADTGDVDATLSGVFPWVGHRFTDRLEAWGAAGYGQGELQVTPRLDTGMDGAALTAELNCGWRQRACGAHCWMVAVTASPSRARATPWWWAPLPERPGA